MKMKEVCARTSLTERSVRFYAEEGLIKPASSEMNGRMYFNFTEADIKCLNNIAVLRKTGFTIEQILKMQRKPGTIPDAVSALRLGLNGQKAEVEKSLDTLNGIKTDNIPDIDALAAQLRSFAEMKKLPAIDVDLEPDFGRFDLQSREEKQKAYRDFIINSNRRGRRNRALRLSGGALLLITLSVFVTLLAAGYFKTGTDKKIEAASKDYLVGPYEPGEVELTFLNEAYNMTAEGLHGGTLRMTRVYSDTGSGRELSLSWSFFSEPENQFVRQVKLNTGAFEVEKGLGNAVIMAILPAETDGEYFAVYAESEDMTWEEVIEAVSGNVDVSCDWGVEYKPQKKGK